MSNPSVKVTAPASIWSGIWWTGWLFTIGFMHLDFWAGLWALFVWPVHWGYYVAQLVQ